MTEIRVNMEADWQTSPDAVRRQPEALQAPLAEFLRHVRRDPPNFVLTCARGSSAHAATFGKHLLERHLGLPVGAFAPNIATPEEATTSSSRLRWPRPPAHSPQAS